MDLAPWVRVATLAFFFYLVTVAVVVNVMSFEIKFVLTTLDNENLIYNRIADYNTFRVAEVRTRNQMISRGKIRVSPCYLNL